MFNKKGIDYLYIFFILGSVFSLFFFKDPFVDHFKYSDQDFVHVYNALKFNNFSSQEYFDHPGFTSFLFLSICFFLFEIIGVIDYSNFIDVETNSKKIQLKNFFENLIYLARFFNLVVLGFVSVTFFYILKILTQNITLSFLLSLLFITSIAFYNKLIIIRTEDLSILFLLISFLTLIKSITSQSKKFQNIYEILTGIFIIFSLSAKIQSILIIAFFPIISKILFKEKSFKNFDNQKNFINIYFLFPFFLLNFILIINSFAYLYFYKNFINYF